VTRVGGSIDAAEGTAGDRPERSLEARLDQIVDLNPALVKLARSIVWRFLEQSFGIVYHDGPGQPPLPTRLMAGLAILKHMHNLSDEALCDRRLENPYYQLFCGEEFFRHELPFDRSSMTRWRQRMGDERLVALFEESLATATRTNAAKPSDFSKLVVDTTVQPKAVAYPTDARLMHRARERLVGLAKRHGIALRQSYTRVGEFALVEQSRYAHAEQFEQAGKALRKLKTHLGRVIRTLCARSKATNSSNKPSPASSCWRAGSMSRTRTCVPFVAYLPRPICVCSACMRRKSSASAPSTSSGGKPNKPYEFGVKVSVATTLSSRM